MSAGIKANVDGSAAIQVGGTDVITLTSGGAATFVTSPTTVQAGTAAAPSITTSGDTNTGIFFPAADTIAFAEGGAEVARFDSSGNFGLGVTPSAWGSSYKVFEQGSLGGIFANGATPIFSLGANCYNTGSGWLYKTSTQASLYQTYSGQHLWLTAASGTAGNAITFTQAMTLDASGNLGIGNTPVTRLDVTGIATVRNNSAAFNTTPNTNYGLNFQASSSGECFITSYSNGGSTSVCFATNNGGAAAVEGARLTTDSNFLVGGTSQTWDERFLARRTTNAVVGGFYSTASTYTSAVIRAQTEAAAGTGWYLFEGRAAAGAFQYGIRGNGTVATSDARRKKNIEPARSYLQDICSIPVVKYNWKTDSDDTPKELGWLAQDVEKVFPNMVVTHHDGPNDDQEVLLLKKEVFVPMLMKCIQEQQTMIDELKAKVAALEGASQ